MTRSNFVRLGRENYTPNAQFNFELRVNLICHGRPFILLGFRADYIVDSCYCLNESDEITVNGIEAARTGEVEFEAPMPIQNGIAQVA